MDELKIHTVEKKEDMLGFYEKRRILPDMYYTHKYNNTRRGRIIVIGCCMRKYHLFDTLDVHQQETYIRRIERSCYNHACMEADNKNVPRNWQNNNFQVLYNMITYRVQKNLVYSPDDPGSDYLISKIVNGGFDVNNIGKMKSKDLRPIKTQSIYDDIEIRKQQKIVKKYSTQYECFKCGGRKTTEVELQLRSLDEGSTIIITCEMDNCTNSWRLSS